MAVNLNTKFLLQQYGQARQNKIERLLEQYGTSLKETREMYPQLLSAIEERRKVTAFPTQELFFTPEEARDLGLSLQEGWMLKFTPSETGYSTSFITPEKWEITEDETYISPEGTRYSRSDIEQLLTLSTISELPEEERELALAEAQETAWAEMLAEGGTYTGLQVKDIFGQVFPEQDIEEVFTYASESPEEFVADLREIGWTEETESLLKIMYPEITEEEMYGLFGRLPEVEESGAKNVLDTLYMAGANLWYQIKQGVTSLIPQLFTKFFEDPETVSAIVAEGRTPEMTVVRDPDTGEMKFAYTFGGPLVGGLEELEFPIEVAGPEEGIAEPSASISAIGKWAEEATQNLRAKYEEKETEMRQWLIAHPELQTPKEWEGGIIEKFQEGDWETLKSGWYWANVAAESAAFTGAFIGTSLIVGTATGNPYIGLAAGWAVTTPAMITDLYEDLLASGATEDQALQLSVPIGAVINSVEIWGDLPFLRAVSPVFSRALTRNIKTELVNLTWRELARKGLKTFTNIEIAETLEEVIQQAIQNATVATIDENRWLLEGIDEVVVRTLVATLPLAILGGGTQTARLYSYMNSDQKRQVSETIKKLTQNGVPREQAELVALANVLETPEGQKIVGQLVDDVNDIPEVKRQVENALNEIRENNPDLVVPAGGNLGLGVKDVGEIMDTSSVEALLTIPDSQQIIDGLLVSNWIRTALKKLAVIPGVKKVQEAILGWRSLIDKDSQVTEDIVGRGAVVYGAISRMGTHASKIEVATLKNIIANAVKYFGFNESGYSAKMAGRLLSDYESERANAGTLEHTFTHPEMYDWTNMDKGLEYVTRFNRINRAVSALLEQEGVAINNVNEAWMHRVVTGKMEGAEEVEVRGKPGVTGRAVGKVPSYKKPRAFATMAEGIQAAYMYEPNPEASVGTYIEEAFKEIAGERFKNLVEEFGVTPSERLLERFPEIAERAARTKEELADAARLHEVILRAKRGERLPEQTLRAMEKRFPDLGRRLRALVGEKSTEVQGLRNALKQMESFVKSLQEQLKAKEVDVEAIKKQPAPEIPADQKIRQAFEVLEYEDRLAFRNSMETRLQEIGEMVGEQDAEIEGLTETLQTDPIATFTVHIGKIKRNLDYFLKHGEFPESFTLKEAAALTMKPVERVEARTKEGRVPSAYVIDELADHFNLTEGELIKRIEGLADTKERLADLKILVDYANERAKGIQRMLSILAEVEGRPENVSPEEPDTTAMAEWEGFTGEVPEAKEPWQMTREEFIDDFVRKATEGIRERVTDAEYRVVRDDAELSASSFHKEYVQQALSEGKPVPAEVLKDYPDLAKEIPTAEVTEIATGQPYTATVYRGYKVAGEPVDEGLFGKGTYYTTNKEYAETYDGKEVMTVNLKNPFVIQTQQEYEDFQNETTRTARQEALNEGKTVEEADELAARAAREWLESRGYDGLIARNIIAPGDEIVVFEPERSVTAKGVGKPEPIEVGRVAPERIANAPDISGKVYRVHIENMGIPSDATAADILRFERDELGNSLEDMGVSEELLAELENYRGSDVIWVCREKEDAAEYLSEGMTEENISEFELPEGSKIVADDQGGGYLVLFGDAISRQIIPTAEAGMPEAGVQTDIFGYQTPVTPRGKGKFVQISMEDLNNLIEHYKKEGIPVPNVNIKPKVEGVSELSGDTEIRQVSYSMPDEKTAEQRKAAFNSLASEAKTLMEARKAPYWQARTERAAKMEIARQPGIGEGYLPMPFAGGKIYGQDFIDSCNKFFGYEKGSSVLKFTSDAAGILRITKAALDFSAMMIQGLPSFGMAHAYLLTHPRIGAKLIGAWYKALIDSTRAFFKPEVFYSYMAKNEEGALQRVSFGGSSRAIDYFEALKAKHGLGAIGSWVLGKIPLNPYERAELSFFSAGEIVRDAFWKALSPKAIEQGKAFELARSLDIITGLSESQVAGVPLTIRQLESSFMWFAPNYTRACLSLIADIFRGGYTGLQAKRALGGLILAMPVYYIGIQLAMSALAGKDEDDAWEDIMEGFGIEQDPITGEYSWRPTARFLSIKVGNYYFGPGGFWYGLVRLAGNIASCINEVGDREHIDLVKILDHGSINKDNPFVYWWYTRSSPLVGTGLELFSGKDFLGYPIETPWEYARYLMTRFEPIWMEQGINWMIPGAVRDYEIPEDEARAAVPLFEIFGWRTFPESAWVKFYDQVEDYIKQIPFDELDPKQVEAWENGKLGWGELTKKQKQDLLERYPELAELYEDAQEDSKLRETPEWEAYLNRIDEERGVYYDRIDEYTRRLLDGEIDTRKYRELCSEAGQNYGSIMEAIQRDPTYAEIFEYFDKKEAEGSKYEFRWDLAYAEYSSRIRFAEDPEMYLENGDYNWDERDRRIDEFVEKWGIDLYEEILNYISQEREEKGLNDVWIRRSQDTEKLGREYWRLPYQSIMEMTEEDYEEGNIPADYYALWKQYQGLSDAEKEVLVELNPELAKDWRAEYRKNNPEADAMLALWGYSGKIQSMEAYNLLRQWSQELGVSLENMGLGLPPQSLIEDYFDYGDISTKFSGNSAEAKLWRMNHPDFTNWAMENWGWQGTEEYRGMEYYELQIKFRPQQAEYDAIKTTEERKQYLYSHPDFQTAYYTLKAMDTEFPEPLIPDWVDWYSTDRSGYEDDWWLMEHEEFYKTMMDMGIWTEPRDFSTVPTREVWNLYEIYQGLPTGNPRLDFRSKHPELDAWLVLKFGYKPIEDRGEKEAEKTPWEEGAEVEQFQELF